ncbi:putative enoyl-CoA hydratase 1 [Mycobacterium shinjukuense]|uniref:Putative enoyl-CoA hydratase 1 n=1 Tax=Mycobacterium shinjukuense TaxID=398694 RepID=A0A7I7MV64_9MYCO|nr:putative enoyl-CoA hydratase 1 [Mycobacterium shinjukuense]
MALVDMGVGNQQQPHGFYAYPRAEETAIRTFESVADLAAAVGEAIGQSDWVTIRQDEVNLFADATGDHQWIHVDPQRAASGPFGTTIAHGFMTLALLPRLQQQIYTVKGIKLAINYGLNKVRFPAPVPVGSRVRATSSLVGVEDLGDGAVQATVSTTVEVEGSAKPACVAESIVRYIS